MAKKILPIEKRLLRQCLMEWQQESRLPLDVVLQNVFKEHGAGSSERHNVAQAAYLAVRFWTVLFPKMELSSTTSQKFLRELDQQIETLLSVEEIEARLRKKHLQLKPKFEKDPILHLRQAHALPEGLMQSWNLNEVELQNALHRYLHDSMTKAPLCLRVYTSKISRDEVIATFKDFGARASSFSPSAVVLERQAQVLKHPLYLEGLIEIQDESSQLLGDLMAPQAGQRILDYCAGAGGKTLHLAEMLGDEGEVWAYDLEKKKLRSLKQRADRAGLKNIRILNAPPSKKEKFDQVLMDVPCSSLGNLRRNPDRIQKIDSWKKLEIQSEIIFECSDYVADKGKFVYSTCTLRPEENMNKLSSLEGYLLKERSLHPSSIAEIESRHAEFDRASFISAASLTDGAKLATSQATTKLPANMLQWSFHSLEDCENSRVSGAIVGDGFFVAFYQRG